MQKTKLNFTSLIKGSLVSVLLSVGFILIFAVLLKFVDFNDSVIKIINQTIKILSIFFGVFSALKFNKDKALLKGLFIGLIYSFIAFFVFSLLNANLTFGLSNIIDLLFSGIFGSICGIFCANFRVEERLN